MNKKLAPALTGLGVFLLYLAFPSYRHNVDGVACAIAIELSDFTQIFQGAHIIYGFAGWLLHSLLHMIGIKLSALWTLQIMDCALGAAGAALFTRILQGRGYPVRIAVLGAIGLGVSYGYWRSAIDAQIYILGALTLLYFLEEALKEAPCPNRLAMRHAAAMLVHGAHALFAPIAVYALLRSRNTDQRTPDIFRYFLISAAIVIASYILVVLFAVRPSHVKDLIRWLGGTAAFGRAPLAIIMNPPPLDRLQQWLESLGVVISPSLGLAAVLWLAAAWAFVKKRISDPVFVWTAVLALLPYTLLTLIWKPNTLHFHVNALVAVWLLASSALLRLSNKPWGYPTVIGLIALLGLFNLGAIFPLSDPHKNPLLQEAYWIRDSIPQNAWIAARGDEEVYYPYFGQRKPLILRFAGTEAALTERLWHRMEKEEPIYVTSRHLGDTGIFPPSLGLHAVSRRGDLILYRITAIAQ